MWSRTNCFRLRSFLFLARLSVSPSSPLYASPPVFMSFRVFFLFFSCLSHSLSVTHRHTHTHTHTRSQKWRFQSSALWKSRYWTGASVRLVALIAVSGRMGVAASWNSWKVSSKTLYFYIYIYKNSLTTWNSPATVKSTGQLQFVLFYKGLSHLDQQFPTFFAPRTSFM